MVPDTHEMLWDTKARPDMLWDMNPGGDQTEEQRARGRKPLPDGRARTTTYKVRVRPAAAAKFEDYAEQRGLTISDALREAMARWCDVQEVNRRVETRTR